MTAVASIGIGTSIRRVRWKDLSAITMDLETIIIYSMTYNYQSLREMWWRMRMNLSEILIHAVLFCLGYIIGDIMFGGRR